MMTQEIGMMRMEWEIGNIVYETDIHVFVDDDDDNTFTVQPLDAFILPLSLSENSHSLSSPYS